MRKLKILLIAALLLFLPGCSLLGEVNDSIEYVNTATNYIENLNTFADVAPQLFQDAVTNPKEKQDLETQLATLKQEIEEFNSINNVPSIAESIHQEIVTKNKILLDEINQVLVNGHVTLDKIENSQLISTMNEITNLLNRINNLVP